MDDIFIAKFEQLKRLKTDAKKELLQQRGREFEDLINDVLKAEGILLRKGYHTFDNKSEQIDGAIDIDSRIFLIETKWVKSKLAASDLFAFIGKIENKFFGTLGIFISKEKLSDNFINALNKGRRQTVLVIHGEDLDIFFSKKNITFKEYVSYTIKLASYDNILHLPVKKYLSIKIPDSSTVETKNTENEAYLNFIKENLLKGSISEENLYLEFDKQNETFKNEVYKYIIIKYSDFWKINRKNIDFTITKNFSFLLKFYKPKDEVLIELTNDYYGTLIFKDIKIYYRDEFNTTFSPFYLRLNSTVRNSFENKIAANFLDYNNNSLWDLENYVTDIIRPIWEHLNSKTKEKFKHVYLNIYIRDTSNKYSQKEFANYLVKNEIINKLFTEKWLDKKLIKAKQSYEILDDNDIKFISRTYSSINQILNKKNWFKYIKSKINNIN